MTATGTLLIITLTCVLTSIVLIFCQIALYFARRRFATPAEARRELERHPTALWEVDT